MVITWLSVWSGVPSIQATQAALPCDNWTLPTHVPDDFCPEVIVDGLTAQGAASVWGMAFGVDGTLYFTRPASGQVMRMTAHAGRFDPPRVFADGLDFPSGIACDASACDVATDTTITRLAPLDESPPQKTILLDHLPPGEMRALQIGTSGRLYTTRDGALISIAADAADGSQFKMEQPHLPVPMPTAFDWSSDGTLWTSQSAQGVRSAANAISADQVGANPTGIAFYRGTAFPRLRNTLLIVTSGSWNTLALSGYQLLSVPFGGAQPLGNPISLIPSNTELTISNASLALYTFFPQHPVTITISAEGWIYIALREGSIVRLRPRPT